MHTDSIPGPGQENRLLTSCTILPCSAHAATLGAQSDAKDCAAIAFAAEFWVLAAVELAEALSAQRMVNSSSTSASGAATPAEATPARSKDGSSSKVIEVPFQP